MAFLVSGVRQGAMADYPGRRSIVFLLPGCGSKGCEFCENKHELTVAELDSVIRSAEAVFIDGCGALETFDTCLEIASRAKDLGLEVGLAASWGYDARLKKLMKRRLLDFIRLEIQLPIKKSAGLSSSIGLVRASGIRNEFFSRLERGTSIGALESAHQVLSPFSLWALHCSDISQKELKQVAEFAGQKKNVALRLK
jgi:hypothetical protein